jgi:hypothetical protein
MRNVAGDKNSDLEIRLELERARIPVVERAEPFKHPEVAQTATGNLPGFTLSRNWYYWVVVGNVPLEVAKELYADPVGRTDVRVDGHCGCPPPEAPWVKWITSDGREVAPRAQYDECVAMNERMKYKSDFLDGICPDDDPAAKDAKQYVTCYHIDSEVGLRLFVDTLRKHGVTQ